jgi:hypothetical protein
MHKVLSFHREPTARIEVIIFIDLGGSNPEQPALLKLRERLPRKLEVEQSKRNY